MLLFLCVGSDITSIKAQRCGHRVSDTAVDATNRQCMLVLKHCPHALLIHAATA